MRLHHDKHHQAYVEKANGALEGTEWADKPIAEVVANLDALNDAFGSFDAFKEQFEAAGVNQFGSGWAWLVLDGGALKVTSSANQDNPITGGATPLVGNDVWEHAYYLKYNNRRPEYLKTWWNVVNWDKVGRRFAAV